MAPDWEPRVALVVSVASLGVSFWTMWANGRGVRAQQVLDLHVKLVKLAQAALEHLRVQVGEYPTEEDVWALHKEASSAAASSPWDDVRAAAERVFERCEAVMTPGVREAPFEVTEEIREGIRGAVDAAGETIGARARDLSRYRLSLRR